MFNTKINPIFLNLYMKTRTIHSLIEGLGKRKISVTDTMNLILYKCNTIVLDFMNLLFIKSKN